jgi:hypothetical protein
MGTGRPSAKPWRTGALAPLLFLLAASAAASSTVYKWVDEHGTLHLSTQKPPAGVQYEQVKLRSSSSSGSSARSGSSSRAPATSPAQSAQRNELLSNLQNRECVIALEQLERLTGGSAPTSAAEINRLKETVDRNCSRDPTRRREQEEMAAKLRESNSPGCVKARNALADLLEAGPAAPRDEVRAQQQFVDENCTPPVK